MTPKEKAIELVKLMSEKANYQNAGQLCALIAVNEIIASVPTQPSRNENERIEATIFWVNVQFEIQKLLL